MPCLAYLVPTQMRSAWGWGIGMGSMIGIGMGMGEW